MKKRIIALSIYQLLFGLFGIILVLFSTTDYPLYMFITGFILFLISVSSGLFMLIKKLRFLGMIMFIVDHIFQIFPLMIGKIKYNYHSGIILGLTLSSVTRNEWKGTQLKLLFNLGSSYYLQLNDSNIAYSIGINLIAIGAIVMMIFLIKKTRTLNTNNNA